jgi:hypothetical protein
MECGPDGTKLTSGSGHSRGAIAIDPKVREWAAGDEGRAALRGLEGFEQLLREDPGPSRD